MFRRLLLRRLIVAILISAIGLLAVPVLPRQAQAQWGQDAIIQIGWETAVKQGLWPALKDLGKFTALTQSLGQVLGALKNSPGGGIITNYENEFYNDILDFGLNAVDKYFDDFLPSSVSSGIKRDAKRYIRRQVRTIEESVQDATKSSTPTETPRTLALAPVPTTLAARVGQFFKAQFLGARVLLPGSPLIAYAQTTGTTGNTPKFTTWSQFTNQITNNGDTTQSNEVLAFLTATSEGLARVSREQNIAQTEAVANQGYKTKKDKGGNILEYPGAAKALLEGNINGLINVITTSDSFFSTVGGKIVTVILKQLGQQLQSKLPRGTQLPRL